MAQNKLLAALSFVPDKLPSEIQRAGLKIDMATLLDQLKKQAGDVENLNFPVIPAVPNNQEITEEQSEN